SDQRAWPACQSRGQHNAHPNYPCRKPVQLHGICSGPHAQEIAWCTGSIARWRTAHLHRKHVAAGSTTRIGNNNRGIARLKRKVDHMISTIDLENTYTTGVYSKRPIAIVRGSGALVWDEEGREYIDCAAGHGVANIGHGRLEIAAALAAQAQRLITCPEIVYNDVRARLLARLAGLTPQGLQHIFLCNSGTEAVEGAFKFARLATGRTEIVATFRGFHGRTMGSLSATWEPHYREP